MALFQATVLRTEHLQNGQVIEKGMTLQFSYFGIPWDGNGPGMKAINDAFYRIYGIDLQANFALNPGYIEVKEVKL